MGVEHAGGENSAVSGAWEMHLKSMGQSGARILAALEDNGLRTYFRLNLTIFMGWRINSERVQAKPANGSLAYLRIGIAS